MSTENQKTNQPNTTFIRFEDNGEKINVQINGKGGDLINLVANAIDSNPDIRMIIELALQSVRQANGEGSGDSNPLLALMAAMAASGGEGEGNDEA